MGQTRYSPDKSVLYAAINGQNTVVALDPDTGAVEHTWNVGIAPRELTFVGKKLYVSNEGDHQALPGETTMDSYGTKTPANGYLGTSTSGTVSVIDTADPAAPVGSIAVGLHPTAMYAQDKRALFVANTNSDTVSVIATRKNRVVQTIETKPWPSSDAGYAPTSIAMTADHLLVTLGRANAVAVHQYQGDPQEPVSFIGLLPTDYYPAIVATVGDQIYVTNTRGIDARGPDLSFNKGQGTTVAVGHGTHGTTASLTRFALPKDKEIAKQTNTVFAQNGWGKKDVQQAGGKKADPVAVPARIGDPSTIKHVFLLVKENRTYDQVYGDMAEGNGDATLAQFGGSYDTEEDPLGHQRSGYSAIPDTYRHQIFKQDFEKNGPANFNMMWLSSDHTGGPPDPRAQVADGDLAVGRIIDEISHSQYWKDSVIFVVEDASQDGADHVDGHRAPVQIISPWAAHGVVDSTYYLQITMVRTIEQILGAQPLNQKLAAATPMYGAFTDRPDFTPFTTVPNQVPLTEGIATAPACGLDTPGQTSTSTTGTVPPEPTATAVPADEQATAALWKTWLGKQRTTGNGAIPDYANPEQMNRFAWYQTHGWKLPYPGDSAIFAPAEVPGAFIPSPDTN